MRHAGRITGWQDDKGFGFVTPHDGGRRAFLHIKAFQAAMRPPMEGDLVSYATRADAKGRVNAVDVRFAGQRMNVRKPATKRPMMRIPRAGIGTGFLAAVVIMMVKGSVPALLPLVYLLTSGVTFALYAMDKGAAGNRGSQRTPESTLHMMGLLGGWPGGLIAQQLFRHKTVKASFQATFWFTVIANLVGVAGLWYSGLGAQLTAMVIG